MTTYTGNNGAIVADDAALIAIPSTNLLVTTGETVLLYNNYRNRWVSYDPDAISGDFTPINNPTNGRWSYTSKEVLKANRTYYCSTTGSDSNNGLTIGSPFLTISKFVSTIQSLTFNGFSVTLQLANGSYSLGSTGLVLGSIPDGANVTIQGNTSDESLVTLTSTSTTGTIQAYNAIGSWFFRYITITNTNNGHGIYNSNSSIAYERIVFGSVGTGFHIVNSAGGKIGNFFNGNYYPYKISAGSSGHIYNSGAGCIFTCASATITLTGTPAFASTFCLSENLAYCNFFSPTFSGSATGVRYSSTTNAVINTFGGGANFLPGNSAGSTATGGQYA